ncbi:MAG: nuclear transport factor 2 family protein [Rhodopila sp.]|jgi:ketosteroid isomerase-like protein
MIRVALCAALVLAAPQIASAAPPGDTSGLSQQLEAAWNAHDLAKFTALFTPDAKWMSMTAPPSSASVRDQTEAIMKANPDTNCVLGSHAADEKQALSEWSCTGTDSMTKKRIEVHTVTVDILAPDGKIKERHGYFDPASLK